MTTSSEPEDAQLAEQYRRAAQEWEESGDAEAWEATTGDGVDPPDRLRTTVRR